jgi:hypothetical protein
MKAAVRRDVGVVPPHPLRPISLAAGRQHHVLSVAREYSGLNAGGAPCRAGLGNANDQAQACQSYQHCLLPFSVRI